jgi:hypothetical protein
MMTVLLPLQYIAGDQSFPPISRHTASLSPGTGVDVESSIVGGQNGSGGTAGITRERASRA